MKYEELHLVIDVPEVATDRVRAGEIEVHVPTSSAPPPVVLFVHGPLPRESVRPPHWALYDGYCRLAAARGLAAATVDLDYVDVANISDVNSQLDRQVADVRARPEVGGSRVALWAFSGGGLLINPWLERSPDWLRCVALSYPVLQPPPTVRTPIVLTRVARERPEIQQTVEHFIAAVTPDVLIDVSRGRHGFDVLDDSDESRNAIKLALGAVTDHLLGDRASAAAERTEGAAETSVQ